MSTDHIFLVLVGLKQNQLVVGYGEVKYFGVLLLLSEHYTFLSVVEGVDAEEAKWLVLVLQHRVNVESVIQGRRHDFLDLVVAVLFGKWLVFVEQVKDGQGVTAAMQHQSKTAVGLSKAEHLFDFLGCPEFDLLLSQIPYVSNSVLDVSFRPN